MNKLMKAYLILAILIGGTYAFDSLGWTCSQFETIAGQKQCDARDLDHKLHFGHVWQITQGVGRAVYPNGSFSFYHPTIFKCTCASPGNIGTTVQTTRILGGTRQGGSFIWCPASGGGGQQV